MKPKERRGLLTTIPAIEPSLDRCPGRMATDRPPTPGPVVRSRTACTLERPGGPPIADMVVQRTPLGALPALDAPRRPTHTPPTSRRAGCERDEYPSSVGRETQWLVETGTAAAANGPGSLRTERHAAIGDDRRDPSRLRRRAPAIQGSADRQGPDRAARTTETRAVGHESAASPNEGGTAEGSTFRPGDDRSFLILEAQR